MLVNENGKSNYRRPSDMDVCAEIDNNILPMYSKDSVYQLSRQEKQQIAEYLCEGFSLRDGRFFGAFHESPSNISAMKYLADLAYETKVVLKSI